MLRNPVFRLVDDAVIRDLIRDHGWAMLVTAHERGHVAVSHLPVVLEPGSGAVSIVGHLGRPDDVEHALGDQDATVVIRGHHGYVSPTWYGRPGSVPTWNYVAVHLTGRPERLEGEEAFEVLRATCAAQEERRADPWTLDDELAYARRIAGGTACFRLRVEHVAATAKLSQDKEPEVRARVIDALESDDVHADRELAQTMRRLAPPPDNVPGQDS